MFNSISLFNFEAHFARVAARRHPFNSARQRPSLLHRLSAVGDRWVSKNHQRAHRQPRTPSLFHASARILPLELKRVGGWIARNVDRSGIASQQWFVPEPSIAMAISTPDSFSARLWGASDSGWMISKPRRSSASYTSAVLTRLRPAPNVPRLSITRFGPLRTSVDRTRRRRSSIRDIQPWFMALSSIIQRCSIRA